MLALLLALQVFQATPTTLADALQSAKPGDRIVLAPGDYGQVVISGRVWETPVTIDARAARLTISIQKSKGVSIIGGTFTNATGDGADGYASRLVLSSNISFSQSTFSNSRRGLVIDRSSYVTVSNATLQGLTIDGINIASSQHVAVRDSICKGFDTGTAHPDCVQLWTHQGQGITSDVVVERNTSIGNNQGFTAFNHVRNGVDDGGFDRITIRDNIVRGQNWPVGIAAYDCRDCTVSGNRTSRLPGAPHQIRTVVIHCTRCTVANNLADR